ncbi:MAG: hypothetical protein J6O55_03750, partial [Lachnospiraceae bacterium]|nr:hypothetical protein [Lachnospiraceae bacterium]
AAECGAFSGFVKPIFLFTIQNAEPSDTEPFYEAVKESLKDVAENGFSKSLVDSVLHGNALNEALSMEGTNIGINNPQSLIAYFMTSGKTDYYEKSKRARDAIYEDTGQEIAKALAQKLINADTGCLNTVVPTPGLAEKEDEEREKYLSDRKSSMSENEIQKLIDDTLAFNEWNENPVHNNDFMVDPKDLPDPEKLPEVKEEEIGGLSLLSVLADIKGVGAYSLRLNTSAVTEEEINDLNFYIMSFLELGTKEHSREEIAELASYYMSGTAMDTDYPGKEGSKYHYPMLNVSWYAMTEDLKESLNLVMEVLRDTDFSDTGELSELIGKYKESYNPATSDADRTALNLSFAYIDKAGAYSEYVNGPGYYSYLKDLEKRLSSEPGFGEEFAERMRVISEKVTGKKGLIFAMAAEDEELNGLKGIAAESLETLSENEIPLSVSYNMGPAPAKKVAVYMDTPIQYAAERYDFADNAEMKGRHFPFLTALSDKYMVPFLRFQNGAYSASLDVNVFMDRALARSYRDPNVSKTMTVFEEIPEKMEEMELTQEDLKGYTARCYGDATAPSGLLSKGMDAVQYYLGGVDLEAAYERVSDIRNASMDDLKAAAEALRKTGQESTFVMSGNRGQMEKDKDAFDLILDYQAEAGK